MFSHDTRPNRVFNVHRLQTGRLFSLTPDVMHLTCVYEYEVIGPSAPVMTVSGEDVILPCSIKPNITAVNMRVEWIRLDLKDSIVHLYKDHKDINTDQLQSYRGRTQVFKEELEKGNTSLKLSRVQISDEGLYKCFIQSESWSDDITVELRVEAVGSVPVITVDGFDGSGGLHLQCESKGWYPEPDLVWLNSEGVTLTSESPDTHRVDTDCVSVMMETEIITSSKMFHSWRSSVILISVAVVLCVIAGILISVFVWKQRELLREKQRIQNEDQRIQKEHEKLQRTVESVTSLLRNFAVNVTLDADSAHPRLIVSRDGKQVRYEEKQHEGVKNEDSGQNNKFDECLCVVGNEGFSSGCFYYEVQVKGADWWCVGVTRESAQRKGWIRLYPQNGFWTVCLCFNSYYAHDDLRLSLSVNPDMIGVFVDYEKGRVSFYDVKSMCHIHSFTDQSFTEKLYPVLSLGSSGPLIICSDLS
ncbi:butyrophilin subfamily 1 member A1-like isoform X2 [Triplophysa dalaica]|uniref:butyrophilin subfamily 1 member A1-like isoform X2 n=2 Tax=Triplophysa dalaica TaxID=1582913 RepID=UPI0024DFF311|nr:butyrophilin subfamily 1 member A1-like isoform X2 [Triplophysa dalaica]